MVTLVEALQQQRKARETDSCYLVAPEGGRNGMYGSTIAVTIVIALSPGRGSGCGASEVGMSTENDRKSLPVEGRRHALHPPCAMPHYQMYGCDAGEAAYVTGIVD